MKSVCEELYGDEELVFEMMYSLIDLESQSRDINRRKGITEQIDKIISKTYYKNEEDALEFYRHQMERAKELGGKYRERFLDYDTEADSIEESEGTYE